EGLACGIGRFSSAWDCFVLGDPAARRMRTKRHLWAHPARPAHRVRPEAREEAARVARPTRALAERPARLAAVAWREAPAQQAPWAVRACPATQARRAREPRETAARPGRTRVLRTPSPTHNPATPETRVTRVHARASTPPKMPFSTCRPTTRTRWRHPP